MALFSAFQVQAEGENYVFGVDETVVLGDLSNFASITATGSNITTGNIYSPDAYIGFLSPFKEEWQIANDLVGASWDELVAVAVQDKLENSIDLSYLTVNGNVEGRFIDMDAVATINGNVVAHGEITEEEKRKAQIEQRKAELAQEKKSETERLSTLLGQYKQ